MSTIAEVRLLFHLASRDRILQPIMNRKLMATFLLGLITMCTMAWEIDTRLTVTGNNPPQFRMTGSGELTSIRVTGPHKQQEVEGEDQYMYWLIRSERYETRRNVKEVSPVTYGKVPDGYVQVYPAHGEAALLVEGEHYHVQIVTDSANGDNGHFTIKNGSVKFAK
jgi:hypothetical protein